MLIQAGNNDTQVIRNSSEQRDQIGRELKYLANASKVWESR